MFEKVEGGQQMFGHRALRGRERQISRRGRAGASTPFASSWGALLPNFLNLLNLFTVQKV